MMKKNFHLTVFIFFGCVMVTCACSSSAKVKASLDSVEPAPLTTCALSTISGSKTPSFFDPQMNVYYRQANDLYHEKAYDKALDCVNKIIERYPSDDRAYILRSLCFHHQGQYKQALADLETVLGMDAQHRAACNNMAWLLATCPDDGLRDGKRAFEFARQTLQLFIKPQSPDCPGEIRDFMIQPEGKPNRIELAKILDSLAAAYAEMGQFDKAIEKQREAISAFKQSRASEYYGFFKYRRMMHELKNHLSYYEESKPWRDGKS